MPASVPSLSHSSTPCSSSAAAKKSRSPAAARWDGEDVFADYEPAAFEKAFARWFTIEEVQGLPQSPRVLYLMAARSA